MPENKESQTTQEHQAFCKKICILFGRLLFAFVWPFWFIMMIVAGAINGAIDGGTKWIKWTPEIWRDMH